MAGELGANAECAPSHCNQNLLPLDRSERATRKETPIVGAAEDSTAVNLIIERGTPAVNLIIERGTPAVNIVIEGGTPAVNIILRWSLATGTRFHRA